MHVECLRFCFVSFLQEKLNNLAETWILHRTRPCNGDTPPGNSDEHQDSRENETISLGTMHKVYIDHAKYSSRGNNHALDTISIVFNFSKLFSKS